MKYIDIDEAINGYMVKINWDSDVKKEIVETLYDALGIIEVYVREKRLKEYSKLEVLWNLLCHVLKNYVMK